MVAKVKPGLYRHWKGNHYRVLFLASYGSERSEPNGDVEIFSLNDRLICLQSQLDESVRRQRSFRPFMEAKNSTDGEVKLGELVVVYVALYGDGRVSVREAREFLTEVQPGVPRFSRVEMTCKACSRSGMEPADMNLTCFHPDAGPVGLHIWKEPLEHCPNFSKFEQHPNRNPDGSLKSNGR